tara:strand:- start:1912 stop:3348 length:1437 start_codon:yes stop_codon:yes gene_type:complete
MLGNIRNFSKTIWAKIIMGFIIIAFATWGMGGMFSGGNSNNIAKINRTNISIDDFMKYLRNINVSDDVIKKNLDKNVLEQILSQLISQKILEKELEENNINISDKILYEKIKKDKRFVDIDNQFSRTEYEKYMLLNNTTAVEFEQSFKEKERVKLLFSYISGGTFSPYFLTNNVYKTQMKEIDIEYINLESIYKNIEINDSDIYDYASKNKKLLEKKVIDYRYVKIYPENLTGYSEYNQEFFDIIDKIENKISEGANFNDLLNELNLPINTKLDFNIQDNENTNSNFDYDIFKDENTNLPKLIEKDDLFILYNVDKIGTKEQNIKLKKVRDTIKFLIQQDFRINYNKNLIEKISSNNFNKNEFYKIINDDKSRILKKKITSKNDASTFDVNSLEILFSLNKNKFAILIGQDQSIYLAYIKNITDYDLAKNSIDLIKFNNRSILELQSSFYDTYDALLSDKYNITINKKSLEKIKNIFK